MSISKIFIPNFMCVLTNERYKTYKTGFLFCPLCHSPGVGLWGTRGAKGVKQFFFQTWSCSISNRWGWWAEQNASNIFSLGSNWWPWGKVKRSNFINMSISKIFTPNFVCSHKWKIENILNRIFILLPRSCPGVGLGGAGGGEPKTLVWGFAMAPHRLRALVSYCC